MKFCVIIHHIIQTKNKNNCEEKRIMDVESVVLERSNRNDFE